MSEHKVGGEDLKAEIRVLYVDGRQVTLRMARQLA